MSEKKTKAPAKAKAKTKPKAPKVQAPKPKAEYKGPNASDLGELIAYVNAGKKPLSEALEKLDAYVKADQAKSQWAKDQLRSLKIKALDA